MPHLTVKEPGAQPERVELRDRRFTIGKHSTNDLSLSEQLVSREHCEIVRQKDGKYLIVDKKSRNGTYVNGNRVEAPLVLRDGMAIQVGRAQLVFYEDGMQEEVGKTTRAREQGGPATSASPEPAPSWRQKVVAPVALKRSIHKELLERLDLKYEDFDRQTDEEIRAKTVKGIRQIVDEYAAELPRGLTRAALVKEIADEALSLGPLEDLMADPEVDEVMVNGWDSVYVERKGKIEKTNLRFTDNRHVINIIRRIVAPIGRRIDESSPMVDARLKDGSRVNAIISPLSISGPTLTIRKFAAEPFQVSDIISFGTLTRQMADFLALAVKYRQNILISGGTGSGKTTLLNIVSTFIPRGERIVTVEDAAELNLPQEHVVSLESKPPNIRGEGAIPIRKLVINSLRMRPDRIIVGECRGGEALDMLQAMNTGHDGSLTTLHANSPRDSLSRLITMVLMAGVELPSRAVQDQIAAAIDLVVHTARLSDGTRRVMNIEEIVGIEGDIVTMQPLYLFRQQGFDREGRVNGYFTATGAIPQFVGELKERHIGVDDTLFTPSEQEQQRTQKKLSRR